VATKLTAAEVRAAKSWLARRNLTPKEISPRKFAKAAKMLDKGFKETLSVIAGQQTGGQV
tara:strand:- start:473 stop:652 length:180 start_codon:yes stop_codon:yes gene_type:complete